MLLNGARQPGSHPALPTTSEAFAEAARGAVRAGAGADPAPSFSNQKSASATQRHMTSLPGCPVSAGGASHRKTRPELD